MLKEFSAKFFVSLKEKPVGRGLFPFKSPGRFRWEVCVCVRALPLQGRESSEFIIKKITGIVRRPVRKERKIDN